ncbi:unnamed protein product, partial [Discosporangium mesarthrocarpum]
MGAKQLEPVLVNLKREATKAQQGHPNPPHLQSAHTTSVSMFDNFFALSWARFGQGWRPDDPPSPGPKVEGEPQQSIYDHKHDFYGGGEKRKASDDLSSQLSSGGQKRDPYYVDLEAVCTSVKYCCFLLEAEVTESALLALSQEILSDKGSLPVGEIGKLLQEATTNSSLSQTLKDQFGGLKKFLEKYPGEFVIASDHPFNPHVYLKSSLTEEEYDRVLRGGTALPGGVGMKKPKKSGRRRQK